MATPYHSRNRDYPFIAIIASEVAITSTTRTERICDE
jgi:hypothetical protein